MNVKFIILSSLISILLIIVFFAPFIVPFDPYAQNLNNALIPPNNIHLFGTDQYGRDLLSRVIIGAQITILSSLMITFITTAIGTTIGIICGYFGGKIDAILMRISDVFLAFPGMVLAIAIAGMLGGSVLNAVIALTFISWPKFARLARAQVLTVKSSTFIAAARLNNCSNMKIMFKHIFPNIIGIILITAILEIGTIIMEIAGLSFLGLGAVPPSAEWGAMISGSKSMLQTAPWLILAPGMAIFISVSLFNLFGDVIRDKYNL
ncbi:Glutathione transport system permease protein gsiD [Megamonas hypermegale]|uniref:Glutathione transport system permease protein gsiD n=1 Tax=Megamonas hypermegale TaxID=158847 RepID=A0A239TDQ6_9FIRM|nr:nickel transporter permease [Megamonas hypermegale]MBM6761121.1 ABC transporter permease [Megamonas hypermegale]SNU95821.1 Glutathione transport system permease protein gsiD [Megamonas hypermegale]